VKDQSIGGSGGDELLESLLMLYCKGEGKKISLKGSHNAQLSFEIMICYHRTGIVHKLISALKI